MVILDIEKPINCLDCPCLHTLITVEDIMNKEKKYAARLCGAAHKQICIFEQKTNKEFPKEWMNFKIPKWCPLKEIKSDDEIVKNLVTKGLGGCY